MNGHFVSFLCCPPARLLSTEAQNYEFRIQEFSFVHTKLYPQYKFASKRVYFCCGHPVLQSILALFLILSSTLFSVRWVGM